MLLLQLLIILLLNYMTNSENNNDNNNNNIIDISTFIKSSNTIDIVEFQNQLILRNMTIKYINDTDNNSLCHILATYNHLNLIEYIINNIDTNITEYINQEDTYGDTCFHKACFNDNINIAKYLKDNGANPLIGTKKGVNPLHSAAFKGHNRIVELLIKEYKVPINIKTTDSQAVPLHYAVGQKKHETVSLLIELGADVNAVNKDNITSLHIAVKNNMIDIAKILIKAGSTIGIKNVKGESVQDYEAYSLLLLEKDL